MSPALDMACRGRKGLTSMTGRTGCLARPMRHTTDIEDRGEALPLTQEITGTIPKAQAGQWKSAAGHLAAKLIKEVIKKHQRVFGCGRFRFNGRHHRDASIGRHIPVCAA